MNGATNDVLRWKVPELKRFKKVELVQYLTPAGRCRADQTSRRAPQPGDEILLDPERKGDNG
jgi:hypothetical protein